MKPLKTFDEFVNESQQEFLLEYTSYRVQNWKELIDGLKEIGAPVELDKTAATIKVDGVAYRAPRDLNDTSKSINYDDKISDALRSNDKLTSMWKDVNRKYSSLLKNLKAIESISGYQGSTEHIDWGSTGPAQINKFFQTTKKNYEFLNRLIGNKEAQKVLREYEILIHLFDRGYASMAWRDKKY